MKNLHKHTADDLIARLEIGPYANIWTAFDEKAVKYFKMNVQAWMWVLKRDGEIVSLKGDNLPVVKLSIDIEDAQTIKNFNRIPAHFDQKQQEKEASPLVFKVDAFPEGDVEFPYWTMGDNGDNTDTIFFFREKRMTLKSANNFWFNYNPKLLVELEQIDSHMADLPPYFKK